MLAREGAWLPSCDLPYHTRRWKFISVGGATQELLARIRANQNSANETAFAIVCVMPYRRDMYWFPRARGCNSCAGRGLPRHQCERGSAIRQPRSCENVDLRAKLFLWASRKKKRSFCGSLGVDPLSEGYFLCCRWSQRKRRWIFHPGLHQGQTHGCAGHIRHLDLLQKGEEHWVS